MNEQLQNELEEQARLLGMSAERECNLRGKVERLERERDAALIGYNECRTTIEDAKLALNAHEHEGLLLASLRIQEQLDTAIMLGKMQERRHERELEQVREQYRLSSVCRKLKAENEKLKQQQP